VMKPRSGLRFRLAFTSVVAFLLLAAFVVCFNPWNWGVVTSSRFTWQRFDTIKAGDSEQTVISVLGEPIRVRAHRNSHSFCAAGECKTYVFAARRSSLFLSYQEAWVVVGRDGHVERTIVNQQP